MTREVPDGWSEMEICDRTILLDPHGRRWVTTRKVHTCFLCGRRMPVGSRVVLRRWVNRWGRPDWIRECPECSDALLRCSRLWEGKSWSEPLPVRAFCSRCDDFPTCDVARGVRESEPGDVMWELAPGMGGDGPREES